MWTKLALVDLQGHLIPLTAPLVPAPSRDGTNSAVDEGHRWRASASVLQHHCKKLLANAQEVQTREKRAPAGLVGGENLHVQFGITRDVSRLMAGANLHLQMRLASTSTFLWTPISQSMTLREATHVRGQSRGSSGVVDFIMAGTASCMAIHCQ